jgi:NAD(P)H-flavin reductase
MALQLGNAAKFSSLTNLQVRLPAVVIGGGLTSVDTATELQAYYITLVEKVRQRYDILIKEYGEKTILAQLDPASREILTEYLHHGQAIQQERKRADAENKLPNFIHLIHEWGGVTIAYRRSMRESPAYIHNHEELQKALEEGIYYLEGIEPNHVDLNEHGHVEALNCLKRFKDHTNTWLTSTDKIRLPARSILVATGTQPNTAYEFEHRGTFNRLNLQYQHYEQINNKLTVAHGVTHCKDPDFGPFTSYDKNDHRISLVGDTHPVFHGSVVKAIASGMRTYPKILAILKNKMTQSASLSEYHDFAKKMEYLFQAKVIAITRKKDHVIELSIQAPITAKHFSPGQFYRLQNFETLAPYIGNTLCQMEPLALVAAECNHEQGVLQFIIFEENASSKLCATLKPNEPISLMGPTGVRAKIPTKNETILIIGHSASFAFLRSYGKALCDLGNQVLYLGYFVHSEEIYCQSALENASSAIIWLTQQGDCIVPTRQMDYSVKGHDIITSLIEYTESKKGILLTDVDRIFLMGDTELLRRFQAARQTVLKPYLIKDPRVVGSVYGNMQCMLKGVCAQCLQWQIDPETGQRTKAVFACSWQDQPLEIIDIDHLEARKTQNHLLDKLGTLWVDHLFQTYPIVRA